MAPIWSGYEVSDRSESRSDEQQTLRAHIVLEKMLQVSVSRSHLGRGVLKVHAPSTDQPARGLSRSNIQLGNRSDASLRSNPRSTCASRPGSPSIPTYSTRSRFVTASIASASFEILALSRSKNLENSKCIMPHVAIFGVSMSRLMWRRYIPQAGSEAEHSPTILEEMMISIYSRMEPSYNFSTAMYRRKASQDQ